MSNWRLIEAELVDAFDTNGYKLYEGTNGDKCVKGPISITELAQSIADRVTLTARPVQVKATAECEQTVKAQS
jgi:hypothetical protein